MSDNSPSERRRMFDPNKAVSLGIMLGIPLIAITGYLLWNLNTALSWLKAGHWALLLWGVLPVALVIGWKAFVQVDLHLLHRKERKLQQESIRHHHLAMRVAIENGYSVEAHQPTGEYMILTSPLTIPQGKTTIQQVPNQEQLALSAPHPLAPPFASIRSQIRPGHLILGYGTQGQIVGDVPDLLSMIFAGKPGTGKSTGLLYYLAMLLLAEASVHVFDHQGSLNELADFIPYYGEFGQFDQAVAFIYQEILEREDLWRNGRQVRKPLLVLVDELPAIARWEQKVKTTQYSVIDLAEKIVLENRKHNVYCMLTGQSFPAEVLPTLTRDNCSSRVIFNSSEMHARMAGVDPESRKKLLPLLRKAQPGTAILDVSRRPEPEIVALPYTTVEDLRMIVNGNVFPGTGTLGNTFPASQAVPDVPLGTGTMGNASCVSPEERERILELAHEGVPRREMCLALGKGKHYYEVIKQVLDEEGV